MRIPEARVERVSKNPDARIVKLADLEDNLSVERERALPQTLRMRYEIARSRLLYGEWP